MGSRSTYPKLQSYEKHDDQDQMDRRHLATTEIATLGTIPNDHRYEPQRREMLRLQEKMRLHFRNATKMGDLKKAYQLMDEVERDMITFCSAVKYDIATRIIRK